MCSATAIHRFEGANRRCRQCESWVAATMRLFEAFSIVVAESKVSDRIHGEVNPRHEIV
jgi:hypothetical protein